MKKKFLAAFLAVCMIATMLAVPATAATFDDVDGHWAAEAIERWADAGVVNGRGDGTYDPDNVMTRAEYAQVLVNMFGYTTKSDATFSDVDDASWYADTVKMAVAAGVVTGYSDGTFRPSQPVTFEHAAVMLSRALGLVDIENSSGANWSDKTVETLTDLGMIGADVNEHLVAGGECNRAVVAALADSIIAEYVDSDREEPITGEVSGVVLVVKGAKVEIKDATLAAPVVVDSAEVTLTGTEAKDVLVSGKDAKVAADEASKVENVTMSGENPSIDVKGDIASITVAEGTTGAEAVAPKVPEDKVVNNSTEEATVNGDAVEGKPEETTTPDDNTDNTPSEPGEVTGGDAECTHTKNGADAFKLVKTVAATCGSDGSKTYECSECGATKVSAIKDRPAHSFQNKAEDGTVTIKGDAPAPVMVDATKHAYTCTVCGATVNQDHIASAEGKQDCTKCAYAVTVTDATNTPPESHTAHTWDNGTVTTPATCKDEGVKTYHCTFTWTADGQEKTCDATKTEKLVKTAHTFTGAWTEVTAATCVSKGTEKRVCSAVDSEGNSISCTAEEYRETAIDPTNHAHEPAVTEALAAVAPTCQADGKTAGKQCPDCKVITVKQEVDPKIAHTYDTENWTNSADGTMHVHACKNVINADTGEKCGAVKPDEGETKHSGKHVWTITDGASTGVCSVCSLECAHTKVSYQFNEAAQNGQGGTHVKTCDTCGKVVAAAEACTGTERTLKAGNCVTGAEKSKQCPNCKHTYKWTVAPVTDADADTHNWEKVGDVLYYTAVEDEESTTYTVESRDFYRCKLDRTHTKEGTEYHSVASGLTQEQLDARYPGAQAKPQAGGGGNSDA